MIIKTIALKYMNIVRNKWQLCYGIQSLPVLIIESIKTFIISALCRVELSCKKRE